MSRRSRILLVLALGACTPRPARREPVYQGRSASAWLATTRDRDPMTAMRGYAALRLIGADAVPVLVDSLRSRDKLARDLAGAALLGMCTDAVETIDSARRAESDTGVARVLTLAVDRVREGLTDTTRYHAQCVAGRLTPPE